MARQKYTRTSFIDRARLAAALGVTESAIRWGISRNRGLLPSDWYEAACAAEGRELPRDLFTFRAPDFAALEQMNSAAIRGGPEERQGMELQPRTLPLEPKTPR